MGVSGIDTTEPMPVLYNRLCLITKKYIHSCKCKGTTRNEKGLILKVEWCKNIYRENVILLRKRCAAIKSSCYYMGEKQNNCIILQREL